MEKPQMEQCLYCGRWLPEEKVFSTRCPYCLFDDPKPKCSECESLRAEVERLRSEVKAYQVLVNDMRSASREPDYFGDRICELEKQP